MDPVQPRIFLIYTTNNEKSLAPKVCSKKNFQKHILGFVADFGRFAHIYSHYLYIVIMFQQASPRSTKIQSNGLRYIPCVSKTIIQKTSPHLYIFFHTIHTSPISSTLAKAVTAHAAAHVMFHPRRITRNQLTVVASFTHSPTQARARHRVSHLLCALFF